MCQVCILRCVFVNISDSSCFRALNLVAKHWELLVTIWICLQVFIAAELTTISTLVMLFSSSLLRFALASCVPTCLPPLISTTYTTTCIILPLVWLSWDSTALRMWSLTSTASPAILVIFYSLLRRFARVIFMSMPMVSFVISSFMMLRRPRSLLSFRLQLVYLIKGRRSVTILTFIINYSLLSGIVFIVILFSDWGTLTIVIVFRLLMSVCCCPLVIAIDRSPHIRIIICLLFTMFTICSICQSVMRGRNTLCASPLPWPISWLWARAGISVGSTLYTLVALFVTITLALLSWKSCIIFEGQLNLGRFKWFIELI